MKARLAVFVSVSLFAAALPAVAVDLKNEDSKKYPVKIHSGATSTSSSIEGLMTRPSVCTKCKIEIEGVGSVEASGSDVVIIKDGKLSKKK